MSSDKRPNSAEIDAELLSDFEADELDKYLESNPDLSQLDTTTRPPPNEKPAPPNGTIPTLPRSRKSLTTLLINPVQKDNPLLKAIQTITYQFEDIVPDFVVGKTSCVIYLSLKYHKLYPEYIYGRLEKLQNFYDLRVLLLLVDTNDYEQIIRELTKATVYANITIFLAWSIEEAGKYIETLKSFENKPPDMIKEKVEPNYMAKMAKSLTQIRSVNKTDVLTLVSKYGSLSEMSKASTSELALLPGFGDNKAKRLNSVFAENFSVGKK